MLSRRLLAVALLLGATLTGCASPPGVSPEVRSALAPTGRLRASINLGNPVLAQRDKTSGALSGVSVDLAQELGRRLDVPVDLLAVDSAGRSVEVVTGGAADIGFFAVDPVRGQGVTFTAPYVVIEGAYLVKTASPLRSNDEVDRDGVSVAVGKGSAYDLYLTREIKRARLVRVPTSPQVVDDFMAQGLDVAAGVRQQLEADAKRVGGVRLLPGRFMVIEQAMGLPNTRSEVATTYLRAFVEDMKSSGFVARSLDRNGVAGALVAPLR
ncbi:ABC transporter substrate-binding protein [soil metagenome]